MVSVHANFGVKIMKINVSSGLEIVTNEQWKLVKNTLITILCVNCKYLQVKDGKCTSKFFVEPFQGAWNVTLDMSKYLFYPANLKWAHLEPS